MLSIQDMFIYSIFKIKNLQQIKLVTDSIKLLSVSDAHGAIVGGQTQGFLQGANWIADLAMHCLDTKLLIRQ
jgi:hypothetical protein